MMTDHCTKTTTISQCDNDLNRHAINNGPQSVQQQQQQQQRCDNNELTIDVNIKHQNRVNRNMSCSPKNDNDDQNDQSSSTTTTSSSSKTTTTSSGDTEKKALKSLLKKKVDPNQDFIKSHNKKVKFSETMQVFCYEMPDNQMPQIIALKPDMNLMELPTYMYDPPAEYQDLLTFEPPPDYRDFIANSLNVFRNDVTFDYIDDDDDSENIDDSKENRNPKIADGKVNHQHDPNQNSKWQSMILNNNLDNMEEEQIIGVLKDNDILQAIGSQVTLPVVHNTSETNGLRPNSDENEFEVIDNVNNYEENLSSADFPVHHLNSYFLNSAGHLDEDDEEACCIDSSPNGSLQDLASDSSITSQDTIILINQNKAFHLESMSHSNIPNDQINNNENIYENLQPSNREISIITQMVNGVNNQSSDVVKDKTDLPKDQNVGTNVLYENTGELLSKASLNSNSIVTNASLVSSHIKNFENRLSTSSSEDGKTSSSSDSETRTNNNNTGVLESNDTKPNNDSFKQNIMFYEKIMEHQQQPPLPQQNNNKNKILNDSNTNSVTINMQVNVPSSATHKYLAGNSGSAYSSTGSSVGGTILPNNLMPLSCYTILETNRTSSSSSLSSASSSSSLLVTPPVSCSAQNQVQSQPQQQSFPLLSTISTSIHPASMPNKTPQPQTLNNSSSPVSSTSNSSTGSGNNNSNTVMNQEFSTNKQSVSGNSVQQINISIADKKNISDSNINSSYPNISGHHNVQQQNNHRLPNPPANQSHICIVNNAVPNSSNIATLRPGQVIYRYPYALIQPGMNGVSTIRPVQYIVQTGSPNSTTSNSSSGSSSNSNNNVNTNNNQPSIIYNPKLVVSNQLGSYTISPVPPNASGTPSSTPNIVMSKPTAIIQQAQIVVPTNSSPNDSQNNSVPVRRIIVPQGTTVLAPQVMQLHPQHKQHPPPSYQCYVQQRPPTATVMTTYPPNVQIRQTTIRSQYPINEMHQQHHTEFPNPSEIRRRDGLYAYPQVLIRKDDAHHSSQNNKPNNANNYQEQNSEDKDELEAFVQQEHQRTERIKKRYSFTEDDDPTFGFARRPSVRGIRPKFAASNEIIQQMSKSGQPGLTNNNNITVRHQANHHPVYVEKSTLATCGTLPKNPQHHQQFIQINPTNPNHPQMISIVKQIGDMYVGGGKTIPTMQQAGNNVSIQQLKSQTLPRQLSQAHKVVVAHNDNNSDIPPKQHEIVRIIDASMLNGPVTTLTRDQLKAHLQKQQKILVKQQQQQPQQQAQQHRVISSCNNIIIGSNHQMNHHQSHDDRVPQPQPQPQQVTQTKSTFSPNHPQHPVVMNAAAAAGSTLNNPKESILNNSKDSNQHHHLNNSKPSSTTNLVNNTNDNLKSNSSSSSSEIVYYSLNV